MEQIRRHTENQVNVNLVTFIFKQGDNYVTLAPSIELSGYGDSKEDSNDSFNVVLEEFISYSLENKILADNLIKLGWNFEEDEHPGELDYNIYSKEISDFINVESSVEYSSFARTICLNV